ncbi:SDR family NAD(P)-dependent oxidoreductase [Psychromonas sp. SP041]|uniref:SDR family NAD(P)-dependent oxidoreductase n=1 Tax=Psychromonas sp. SP041 TaxID=1365007 RepID=UPI0004044B2B|nr:SDR family NAD(P)-dependent oxidoreductase [Psychromonas sp. SP041]
MSNKTILITGATSGIGYSLFEQYSEQGEQVIACGRNQQQLSSMGDVAFKTCCFDITDQQAIEEASRTIESLDVLILNAGNCRYIDDAKHFDGELFADVIQTNLISLGWLLQYLLPKVKKGGQVVFVSSSATLLPFQRSEAYGASKAGVDYLAKSLKLDLIKEEIDVTLIHPGFIKTPLTDKNDFSMPFLLSSDEAASRIITAIEKRKSYAHFPKRLTLLLKAISLLPDFVWQKIIVKD